MQNIAFQDVRITDIPVHIKEFEDMIMHLLSEE